MKLAIIDKDNQALNDLSQQICSHYFPEEDVFVYKFTDNQEFMNLLLKGTKFKIIFIDNNSSDPLTLKVIQEVLPGSITIGISNTKLPITSKNLITKPFDYIEIYEILVSALKDATIKPSKIRVFHEDREAYIKLQQIYYFESYYGKIYAHTKNNHYTVPNNQLYRLENILMHYGFVSIRKSILLNMANVKFASKEEYVLYNDEILYPSARRKASAYKTYTTYMDQLNKYPIL